MATPPDLDSGDRGFKSSHLDGVASESGSRLPVKEERRDRHPCITPRPHSEKDITSACRAEDGGSTSPCGRACSTGVEATRLILSQASGVRFPRGVRARPRAGVGPWCGGLMAGWQTFNLQGTGSTPVRTTVLGLGSARSYTPGLRSSILRGTTHDSSRGPSGPPMRSVMGSPRARVAKRGPLECGVNGERARLLPESSRFESWHSSEPPRGR